jgi:hypothetical protein
VSGTEVGVEASSVSVLVEEGNSGVTGVSGVEGAEDVEELLVLVLMVSPVNGGLTAQLVHSLSSSSTHPRTMISPCSSGSTRLALVNF